MQVNNQMPGGDFNTDELLRQSFLDLDQNNSANNKLFEEASKNIFSKDWPCTISAAKEAQILKTQIIGKWFWFIASTAVVVVTTSFMVYFNYNVNNKTISIIDAKGNVTSAKTDKKPSLIVPIKENNNEINNATINNKSTEKIETKTTQLSINSKKTTSTLNKGIILNDNSSSFTENSRIVSNDLINDSFLKKENVMEEKTKHSIFPILNSSQIEEAKREKLAIVEEATTKITFFYARVFPSSKAGYNGKVSQQIFNLKTTEVTVREYRAFLNDLLINKKFEEYENSKPRYNEIFADKVSESDKKFFDKYFTSSTYNNYPIVLITAESAKLYCAWLQEAIIKNDGLKFSKVNVDLPNESEWIRAAGKNSYKYATQGGKIKRIIGGYNANFIKTQHNDFSFIKQDSRVAENKSKARKNIFTCSVTDYGANENGIYNMSGNVSEMVYDKNKKVIAKGGNWNSELEFLQINDFNEFISITASPFIGFRPLITFK